MEVRKRKKRIAAIYAGAATLMAFAVIVYFSKTTYTAQTVTVEKVRETAVVVADERGFRNTVKIPSGMYQLIEEGGDYYISYKTRLWRESALVNIKPIDVVPSENAGSAGAVNNGNGNRFSYLEQLPPAKQEAFIKYKEERKLHYLSDFSPEEMVIVYLHCLSVGDPDSIYPITYNAGLLPDQDTFRKQYFEYAANHDSEIAVHYRYYQSIKVDETTAEENMSTVLVTAGVGSTTHSLALGLRREDKIWKLDIYHMIKHYIENGL